MTRLKVISIAFLSGLIVGCALPAAHAMSYEMGQSIESVSIDRVSASDCLITLDGDDYELSDCDDVDQFEEGDLADLVRNRNGSLFVVNDSGYDAELVAGQ